MTSKGQLLLAYGLAAILLLVSFICYAAFPPEAPDPPYRVMYHTAAGKVLFDHAVHTTEKGYGLACADCHHHPMDDEGALISCHDCHQEVTEEEPLPQSCLDCHEADEIEGSEIVSSADAAHGQCINCHEDYESGPMDCSGCHVL